jgi:hypothetical protein
MRAIPRPRRLRLEQPGPSGHGAPRNPTGSPVMRRLCLTALLLVSGCSGSGFWRYQRDTFTFPWQDPNGPVSTSENYLASRHGTKTVEPPVMLTEAGDIWPGPTGTVPTLKDLQKQQLAEINNVGGTSGLAALPPLPSLPGYEISNQEPGNPAPGGLFTGGVLALPGGGHISSRYSNPNQQNIGMPPPDEQTLPTGDIVVPNGNGTSTVISPTGKVTTTQTPK